MGSIRETGEPYDLDVQLATCVEEFERDWKAYWAKRADGGDWGISDRLIGHAERVADILLKDTEELAVVDSTTAMSEQFEVERTAFLSSMQTDAAPLERLVQEKTLPSETLEQIKRLLDQIQRERTYPSETPPKGTLLKLVWDRLSISLALDFVDTKLVTRTNRLLQLCDLLLQSPPSVETTKFLRRVSRCYVWGFHTECVILCRGAIDTAFQRTVADAICDKHGLERTKIGHSLANRIVAAHREGMIDDAERAAAFRVNANANTAVHRDPSEPSDTLTVISDTRNVVQKILAYPNS